LDSIPLIALVEFSSLALVFDRFGSIRGWTLGEVAFLYGMVEISFALMDMLFAGFDPPYFGQYVRRGTFDQLLLRPVNITVQVMGSALELKRLGRIVLGMGILYKDPAFFIFDPTNESLCSVVIHNLLLADDIIDNAANLQCPLRNHPLSQDT